MVARSFPLMDTSPALSIHSWWLHVQALSVLFIRRL